MSSSEKPPLVRVTTKAALNPPLPGQTCLTGWRGSICHFSRRHYVSLVQSHGPINLLVGGELVRGVSTFTGRQPAACHSNLMSMHPDSDSILITFE